MLPDKFRKIIAYVQTAQLAALVDEHIEKFDVTIKQDRLSVWISYHKDRCSNHYFYDVLRYDATDEKIEEMKTKFEKYYNVAQGL